MIIIKMGIAINQGTVDFKRGSNNAGRIMNGQVKK